ncbi:rho GDP dissociation inhibitor [Dimargaris cristalligena]|uniref:Rho GDP-dissociation inhibitor n=1 Tax=Dimargaris cristalligena TaxID=215637 RepID=A0A4P9ZSS2_9FUNG|nr:rho GDP dissociation inhibitor [Dimargaris cristalligena]RKP36497.1 immunoglobulin E-set [Dimargaris cristalligena]|eukprot:RKP36497.1 immunoglobulin E-set [Dimargaris cristalligena]
MATNPNQRIEDELVATETEGYKVGEKKTLEEYQNLDANDESLNRWKQSLGIGQSTTSPANDPRRVVIESLALEVAGRPDVLLDLSTPQAIQKIKETPVTIKEGVEYRLKVKFRVQHDVVSGLKFLQVVKRKGIPVDKSQEMIGSYGPAVAPYEKKFLPEEAPKGMLARGNYKAKSRFEDDDRVVHAEWEWTFDIKKDWE